MSLNRDVIKVTRTTFEVDGTREKCIIVSNDCGVEVRFSKMYYYLKSHGLYVCEFIDGEYNNSEEWVGDFDKLSDNDAIKLAKDFSIYL